MRIDEMNSWEDLGAPFFSLSNSAWALVPLEAWRRGLAVTLQPNAHYTISDGYSSFPFWQTRLTGEQGDAIARLCDDKQLTREALLRAGVPAPQGTLFSGDIDKKELADYAADLGYPVCLKPNNWAKAKGVFPKLTDAVAVDSAINVLVDDLGAREIVVEQHIPGDTLRVFVAGDKVIGATWAEAANVVGDGTSTISELVAAKATVRASNPHLKSSPLVLDADAEAHLSAHGLSGGLIPSDGQTITLRAASNLALGGDSWDVTDEISARVAKVAIASVAAVPGLRHAGVDLLVDDCRSEAAQVFVNELNPSAGLGGHIYPEAGERRDVASAIVDQYFPGEPAPQNTKNWYFSLNQIVRLFTSRVASDVALEPMPEIVNQHWKTLRFEGADTTSLNTLRRELLSSVTRSPLHGTITAIRDQKFDLAITGPRPLVTRFEKTMRDAARRRTVAAKLVTSRPFSTTAGFISG